MNPQNSEFNVKYFRCRECYKLVRLLKSGTDLCYTCHYTGDLKRFLTEQDQQYVDSFLFMIGEE